MNLNQYLIARNLRKVDFSRSTGLNISVVSKLCNTEKYKPSVNLIKKVYAATGGAVTADDLLGLSRLPSSDQQSVGA